jgi:hypothetical protein
LASEPKKTNGKAIVALILGLLAFCVPVLLSIPAIILGFLGLGAARRGQGGGALAIIGIVCGFLSMCCGVGYGVGGYFMWIGVEQGKARIVADLDLKQIGMAMHAYNDTYRKLPQHANYAKGPDQKPLLSWRVHILPYIEQGPLHQQFRLEEPWDSPHNKALVEKMPKIFAHPLRPDDAKKGLTYYQVFVGEKADRTHPPFVRDPSWNTSIQRIMAMDGSSNTFLVVEASQPVIWTKPDDISFSPDRPLPKLGLFTGGFMAVMGDGSTRFVPASVSDATLRKVVTCDGGEVIGGDW